MSPYFKGHKAVTEGHFLNLSASDANPRKHECLFKIKVESTDWSSVGADTFGDRDKDSLPPFLFLIKICYNIVINN